MDYNPYNRNSISQNDLFQRKLDKLNETNNWILGNTFTQNNKNNNIYNNNLLENRKDNNILILSNDYNRKIPSLSLPNDFNYNQNYPPYLIYTPIQLPQMLQLYPSYQTYKNNSSLNSQINIPPISIPKDNNINDFSLFGLESKRREEEKYIKKEEYRQELLKQIEEKKKADEEKKKKMMEEEKKEQKKNEEYFKLKKKQADEQARRLKQRIASRMQLQQYEDPGYASNILEISKDFENMNKSRQGTSLVNNLNLTKNINDVPNVNNNNYNIDNYYENINISELLNNDMVQEQENYINEIEQEYNDLYQSIKTDIDQIINKNKPNENFQIPNFDERVIKKHKQYTNYIFGKSLVPPTPLSFDKNILSNSTYIKTLDKNKEINLEEFFNKDEPKAKKKDKKRGIKTKEIRNAIEKEYFEIFENLEDTKKYTKKYTPIEYQDSESFNTDKTHISESQDKSNNESKNKFYLASYYNSTISNSMYDKENNKSKIEEENLIKIEDSSMRTTENKNKSKTLLEKKLINIKENKEDEEDEEDDEENKKTKEENKEINENIEENIKIENKNNDNEENNNVKNEEIKEKEIQEEKEEKKEKEEKEEKREENEEEEDDEDNKE